VRTQDYLHLPSYHSKEVGNTGDHKAWFIKYQCLDVAFYLVLVYGNMYILYYLYN
jgi:hypothetical protein